MKIVRDLDEKRWREFIDRHPNSSIFHTPEMFEVFERAEGFNPELWAVIGADGEICALFFPIRNTVLNGVFQYISTLSVAYGSILCAPEQEGLDGLSLLLQAYNKDRKPQLFTELRNYSDYRNFQDCLNEHGFIYEDHLNYLIDLTSPINDVWENFRSNARRNIKKAEKSNMIIEEVEDLAGLSETYQILKKVYSRIRVPLPDISMFEAGFDILRTKKMLKILLARLDGESIGALTLLMHKATITYWYTGILREFASFRASDYLVWDAIKYGSESGYQTFDFGGAGRPDEEYGVRKFKAKYGGQLVNFGRNIKVHSPVRYQISLYGYNLIRKIF